MDRKVIVVPKDGEVFERELVVFSDKTLERHHVGLREYIEQEKLEYKGYKKEAGYTLAMYLISLGNVVFQIDDQNVVYLPETFSEEQDQYFKDNKKFVKKLGSRLSILDMDEGINLHYDESNLDGVSPYRKLQEIIDDKKIVKESVLGKVMRKCIKD